MQGQQRSLFPSSLTRQCWLASKFSLSLRALAPDSAPLSQVTASKVLGISSVCAPGNPLALPKAFCEGSLAGFSPQQCIHLLFGTLTTVFNAFGVGLGRVGRLSNPQVDNLPTAGHRKQNSAGSEACFALPTSHYPVHLRYC